MRFLLLGYGSIGHRHAAILRELGHTVTTVDPDPAAGADYQSLAKMTYAIDPYEINGALICTPPDVRQDVILKVNGHTCVDCWFIEKPFGHFGQYVLEQFEEEKLQVGFCYHFDSSLAAFVDIIKAQGVAHLLIVGGQHLQDWHAQDYRQLKHRYHGTVTDSMPHSVYVARWILGELEFVGAVTGRLGGFDLDAEDTAAVLLRGPGGEPCYVQTDYLRRPRQFRVEAITRDGGWYQWEFSTKDVDTMYRRQMETFCLVCSGDRAAGYPDLADGVAVQRILDKAKEAA